MHSIKVYIEKWVPGYKMCLIERNSHQIAHFAFNKSMIKEQISMVPDLTKDEVKELSIILAKEAV